MRLAEHHRHMHEVGSAIAPEILDDSGVYTITDGRQLPRGFSQRQRDRAPGVLYKVHRPNGETAWVFRPDEADPENPGLKYEATCKKLGGPGNVLYVHPSQRHLVGDRRVPVVFVEGIKKALAVVSATRAAGVEVLVVGILGVWNWLANKKPIDDMLEIPLDGRQVFNLFDDDVFVNPDVADALRRLVAHEREHGAATVKVAYLPESADGSKTGADDYLARGHGYLDLLATFRPFDPEDLAAERLKRGYRLRAVLEDLARMLWEAEWKGMGGHSARDVFKVLVDLAPIRGKLHDDGLRVKVSRGELAKMANVSTRTLQKSIERLEEMGLIYRDNKTRKQRERGAFVLRANVNHYREKPAGGRAGTDVEAETTLSSLQLRAPRLRWSSPACKGRRGVVKDTRRVRLSMASPSRPAVKRLGKIRCAILDVLDAGGGSATLQKIADTLHRKRPRDIRRRNLPMLEEAEVVVVEGDIVSLTDNWLEALDEQRRLGGEIDSVGVDGRIEVGVNTVARRRLENRSKAFQNRHRVESSRHWVNVPGADGHVEDLERIGSTLSESDSRILEAIEAFEGKYGRGSFRWDRASSKELFYSGPIEGFWPEPEELRRIRDYLEATRGVAA
jgi:hypothetical protein